MDEETERATAAITALAEAAEASGVQEQEENENRAEDNPDDPDTDDDHDQACDNYFIRTCLSLGIPYHLTNCQTHLVVVHLNSNTSMEVNESWILKSSYNFSW